MNTKNPASTASAITDKQITVACAHIRRAHYASETKHEIAVARAVLALAAPTAQPTGQTVSREDFEKMSGDLTRAKNLLVRLYDQTGRDARPEKLRGMIEQSTGSWFVWGADRDAIAAVEPSQPAENARLRQIISECAAALGNGSGISPECSVEFMGHLPEEIRAVIASTPPAPAALSPERMSQKCMPEGLRFQMPALQLTGHQLLEALEFLAPDRDEDQMESTLCIALRDGGIDVDSQAYEAGLCCWLEEYPEEGSLSLEPIDAALASSTKGAES